MDTSNYHPAASHFSISSFFPSSTQQQLSNVATSSSFSSNKSTVSIPQSSFSSFVVETSVNEMVLEQLELLKRETERILVRSPSPSNQLPAFPGAGLEQPGVEKVVPTYRANLARRNILVKEKIGSGSYSKVRLAFRLSAASIPDMPLHPDDLRLKTVAVKIVDRRRAPKDYQTRFMPRELDIWATLRHPNVVRLHETFSDPLGRFVFMVSEYLEGGDCLRYVQRVGSLNEQNACHWVAQLCCGVRYMHAKGVCHRDLKLENLFLERDSSHIKIGDLGFARRFGNSAKELSQTYCGSKSYAAPEILKGVPHDAKKSDVWAIGVIAYILLTGKMPFDESQSNRRIIEDQRRLVVLHWERFPQLSETCRAFVDHALTFSYAKRPAVSVLLRHDWLGPHRSMIAELEQSFTSHNSRGANNAKLQQVGLIPLYNSNNRNSSGGEPTPRFFVDSNPATSQAKSPAIYHPVQNCRLVQEPQQPLVQQQPQQQPSSNVKIVNLCNSSDPMVVCSPPIPASNNKQQQMMCTSSSSSGGSGGSRSGSGSSGVGGMNSSGGGIANSLSGFAPIVRTTAMTSSGGTTSASSTSSAATGSGVFLMAANSGDFGRSTSMKFDQQQVTHHQLLTGGSSNSNNNNCHHHHHHQSCGCDRQHQRGRISGFQQFGFQPGNQ